MSTCTIRIEQKDREVLRDLSRELNLPVSAVVGRALQDLKQKRASVPGALTSKGRRTRNRHLEDQLDLEIAESRIRAIKEDPKRLVSGAKLKSRLKKLTE